MTLPTRADDSAEERADDGSEESTIKNVASDVSDHWRAMLFAAGSLAIAYWAAFLNQQMSPKWYVPIMVTFALGAVGYVYLAEHSTIRLGTSGANG